MIRNTFAMAILALAIAAAPPARADLEPLTTYSTHLDGYIDIAPDGSVQDYSLPTLKGSEDRPFVRALDRRIRSWRFTPVTNDGQPVIAHVLFGITLHAEAKRPDELAISISDVKFYDPPTADSAGKPATPLLPPMFPEEPLRAGVGAEVTVVFKLDDDGRVLEDDVSAINLMLPEPMGHSLEARYAKDFRKATLAVAKLWAFPANFRTTCLKPCLLQVPVQFSIPGMFWAGLRAVEQPPLPWATPQTPIVDMDPRGVPPSTRRLIDPGQAQGQL